MNKVYFIPNLHEKVIKAGKVLFRIPYSPHFTHLPALNMGLGYDSTIVWSSFNL